MDEIDCAIICELLKDSQKSFLQISKKLGISSFTVKSRYDKMVKDGVIRGTMINLDLSKLGYQGEVLLLITNMPSQTKEATIKALKKIENILFIGETLGPYDIIAFAPVTDFNDLKNLTNQIKKIPSVQRVNICFADETDYPISPNYGKSLCKSSNEKAKNQNNSVF
jgi:DNA-binding Lrp family transcriptional regulator